MWDTLTTPWQHCIELAWEAYCGGSIPIGAAIYDAHGQLLSSGRNLLHEQPTPGSQTIAGHPLAHAEVNALLGLDFKAIEKHTCQVYTTVEPCPLCVGAICMAGLKTIHYASRDPWSGGTNLLNATPYMRWKQIRAHGPLERPVETAMFCLRLDFHWRSGTNPRFQHVLAAWEREVPETVYFAKRIYETGLLPELRATSATAAETLIRLGQALADLDIERVR